MAVERIMVPIGITAGFASVLRITELLTAGGNYFFRILRVFTGFGTEFRVKVSGFLTLEVVDGVVFDVVVKVHGLQQLTHNGLAVGPAGWTVFKEGNLPPYPVVLEEALPAHTDGVLQEHPTDTAAVDEAMLGDISVYVHFGILHTDKSGAEDAAQKLLVRCFRVRVHTDKGHIRGAVVHLAHTVAENTGQAKHSLVSPELQPALHCAARYRAVHGIACQTADHAGLIGLHQ